MHHRRAPVEEDTLLAIPTNIKAYIARNLIMEQPDEIVYYELSPFCVPTLILPAYEIMDNVWECSAELVHNPTYENNTNALKERMVAADPKDTFKLRFLDCVVMGQMLNFIEFYYDKILLPKTKGSYHFTEKEKAHKEILDEMMEQISRISEDIYALIPMMDRSFCEDETLIDVLVNVMKTLGLDKETKVAGMYIAEEHEMVALINASFSFFDRFTLYGESDFSLRVQQAGFCCSTEIREVKVLFNEAKEKAKLEEDYEMSLSLRDVVVLLMLNNIWQKNYFSDGGDEVHGVLDDCLKEEGRATTEQIRDYMLGTAKELDEYLRLQAWQTDGFTEAMQPIYDFAVEV